MTSSRFIRCLRIFFSRPPGASACRGSDRLPVFSNGRFPPQVGEGGEVR
jgi:hypothetical protein